MHSKTDMVQSSAEALRYPWENHPGHDQVVEVMPGVLWVRLKLPFRLNDLSVACWRHDPEFFGMKGYPHFPDNHKIHTFLYGKRGLIARRLIHRVSEGLFEVPTT